MTPIRTMTHDFIDEHQIVDRYLMNRLSAEEAARFEEHYLGCQHCLDQLELAESLQRGFKRAAVDDAKGAAAAHRIGLLAWLARRSRAVQVGLTLALLGLVVGPLAVLTGELRQSNAALRDALAPRVGPSITSIGSVRSLPGSEETSPVHIVRLSGRPEWVVLSLDLGERSQDRFRVGLYRGDEEIWHQDDVRPDATHTITLSLHSSWLEPGDDVVQVEAEVSGGEYVPVARFPFRVLRSE